MLEEWGGNFLFWEAGKIVNLLLGTRFYPMCLEIDRERGGGVTWAVVRRLLICVFDCCDQCPF